MKKNKLQNLKRSIKEAPLSYYVASCFILLILYTITSQIMLICGIEINDTLTTCFFSSIGGEVLSCGVIQIFKIRRKNNETEVDE